MSTLLFLCFFIITVIRVEQKIERVVNTFTVLCTRRRRQQQDNNEDGCILIGVRCTGVLFLKVHQLVHIGVLFVHIGVLFIQ